MVLPSLFSMGLPCVTAWSNTFPNEFVGFCEGVGELYPDDAGAPYGEPACGDCCWYP